MKNRRSLAVKLVRAREAGLTEDEALVLSGLPRAEFDGLASDHELLSELRAVAAEHKADGTDIDGMALHAIRLAFEKTLEALSTASVEEIPDLLKMPMRWKECRDRMLIAQQGGVENLPVINFVIGADMSITTSIEAPRGQTLAVDTVEVVPAIESPPPAGEDDARDTQAALLLAGQAVPIPFGERDGK